MCKIVVLFNHKGGVGKTTTTFNLGWSLAELGFKTLIVDADPQCNLTAYCLGLDSQKKIDLFYEKKDNDNVFNAIKPTIMQGKSFNSVEPTDTQHKNLKLAAGNILMSEMDIFCAMGMVSDNVYQAPNMKYVGLFNTMVRETARKKDFDIVLIDMSPSSGAFNRSILMGSDYFIIPTYPDFFCYQAIEYLSTQLQKWQESFKRFRNQEIINCLPKKLPKMLGIISQRYRPYKNESQDKIKDAQKWIDKIQKASKDVLAKSLLECDMAISEEKFNSSTQNKKPYNLVDIPDFNHLILISQQ